MEITYSPSENEWNEYLAFIQGLVLEHNVNKLCDLGGGANPILPIAFITENRIDCTVLDISEKELEKAPKEYKKLIFDVEADGTTITEQFDMVLTKMLAEHLKNGKQFHKNVYSMLRPGGIAVHYYPTLYALPFLVNKVIPEWLSSFFLNIFLPRDRHQTDKFPAYYSWCFGPTPSMLTMLRETGFEIILFRVYYGSAYYSRIPGLKQLNKAYAKFLSRYPNPYLSSFAQVVLHKPAADQDILGE